MSIQIVSDGDRLHLIADQTTMCVLAETLWDLNVKPAGAAEQAREIGASFAQEIEKMRKERDTLQDETEKLRAAYEQMRAKRDDALINNRNLQIENVAIQKQLDHWRAKHGYDHQQIAALRERLGVGQADAAAPERQQREDHTYISYSIDQQFADLRKRIADLSNELAPRTGVGREFTIDREAFFRP
jgi:chromosome segregation ATPase